MTEPQVVFGEGPVTIEQVVALAEGNACASLSSTPAFQEKIERGAKMFAARLDAGDRIYGVTTGFGESCLNDVSKAQAASLAINLVEFHGCGTGRLLDAEESASVVAVRLASLVVGWSAVRPVVLESLVALLNARVLPCIPSEGSVGASGDLTPLSYVAAVLMGKREVLNLADLQGEPLAAATVLAEAGIQAIRLGPKESLAMMNGTSVMTGLVCLAFTRARNLSRCVAAMTATASQVLGGNPAHFDPRIYAVKPYAGQAVFARWVREDLEFKPSVKFEGRIQDRYSIRCAPHVVGVLLDSLVWMREWIEIEINGANDNPLIDPDTGDALHGGNFYGGHACFVADGLKNTVANVADLIDRQLALLCSAESNNGLPENLVGHQGPDAVVHHGFKAIQIAASALTAEALKLSIPASVFSRSTECHNQDKVSMGTIAARDALRVIELTERVAAMAMLALCQAVDLRVRDDGAVLSTRALALRDAVRQEIAFNDSDRRQEQDIMKVVHWIRHQQLPTGKIDFS